MKPQFTFWVEGKDIPYYHFHYEKEFIEVLRIRGRRYYFKDGTYLPEYIKEETLKQYDFDQDYPIFDKAMVLIFHSFTESIQRDLDNYSYKPFIDIKYQ